jgi:DNA-binding NtrC family response regulator
MSAPAEATLPAAPEYRKNLPLVVLDDDPEAVEVLTNRLDNAGFPVTGMTDAARALEVVGEGAWRAAVVDVKMPDLDGLAFLEKALAADPGLYVLLITGYYAPESAVDAVKCGAYDFLAKPVDFIRLIKSLDELAELFTVRTHIHQLEEQLLPHLEFHGIFGKSPAMLEVFDLARKVAKHYTNVLVSGPTGSGKELMARAIHKMSPVSGARFAVCNCSALVDTLVESQLFGHVRGAFTGAIDTRAGLF